MKNKIRVIIFVIALALFSQDVYAKSTRGHIITMGRSLVVCVGAPFYGIFVKGPKNVKEAYQYEVWGREKPEKRGRLRGKLFGIWRAPGEEAKGIIDGVVDSVTAAGRLCKEFLSIFFSD